MTSQEALATLDVETGTLSILVTMHLYSSIQGLHTLLFHVSMLHESRRLQFLWVVAWRLLHPHESPYGLARCLRVACFLLRVKIWKQI